MKKLTKSVGLIGALILVFATLSGGVGLALEREKRIATVRVSVEILPLQVQGGRVVNVPWAGSGTIVDPAGLILTNYHVVNENGEWNKLAILLTTRSDSPPEPAFLAEIAAKSPRLDLAVLRIVSDLKGRPVDPSTLGLPTVELGDADTLEVGDELNIFGYPTIGGQTITYTQGRVAGFSIEEGVDYQRAWIKTDATISGGNSGGTAVDEEGRLVGIPTQAGYGDADYFADVRPIQDTNGDGIIDENDVPVPLGGFINALRPVNLAYALIEAARSGEQVESDPTKGTQPGEKRVAQGDGPTFGDIVFASEQNRDGTPKDPGTQFPSGTTTRLFGYFDFAGMADGMHFNYAWTLNGAAASGEAVDWEWGEEGTFYLALSNRGKPMPDGEYQLVLGVDGDVLQQGTATVGQPGDPPDKPPANDEGVTVSGTVVDADTGDPITGAIVFVLNPGVTTSQFLREQDKALVAAFDQTDRDGAYVLRPPLARGNKYSAIVVAEGYRTLAADDVLSIGEDAPSQVDTKPIELSKN
jgi:S1-C subfamily serine protease